MRLSRVGYLPSSKVARLIFKPFADFEVNTCFSIYHTGYPKLLKCNFVSLAPWRWIFLANYFWTTQSGHLKSTSNLCSKYNKNYCTFPGWLVSLYKEKTFLPFKINWSRTLNTATFLSTFILVAPSIYIIFSRRKKIFSLCNFLWLNVPCNQTVLHIMIKLKVLHWQQPPFKWKSK